MNKYLKLSLYFLGGTLALWVLAELLVRFYLESPLRTGFYGSLPRQDAPERQDRHGIRAVDGPGWTHLGWIADPENESYRIVRLVEGEPQTVGSASYGSFLLREPEGVYQVWAVPFSAQPPRLVGEAAASPESGEPPLFEPRISSAWQPLFRPTRYGDYVNDHTIFQDASGAWRLVGITSQSDGDFDAERYFTVGSSPEFPPRTTMEEQEPVADFGELAWAPHVIEEGGVYHMFWSPHRLHQMTSDDGITWGDHRITMATPVHRFFRDPMVLKVAPDQWLLYTTARGSYFSRIDIYQSFDLSEWQYVRSALLGGWGSERNSPFASMESAYVVNYQGRYYLFLTYNNDSFFWPGLLMLYRIWPDPQSYNDTLVFHSDNPYDFGVYRGRDNSPNLLTVLEAHAPEIVHHPDQDAWYITTAGWPWVATLTRGEAAVAALEWAPAP